MDDNSKKAKTLIKVVDETINPIFWFATSMSNSDAFEVMHQQRFNHSEIRNDVNRYPRGPLSSFLDVAVLLVC